MDPFQVSLIRKLLNTNPAFRIGNLSGGVGDIMRDPFFSSTDWNALQQGAVKAPFRPNVKDPLDASNFDAYDEDPNIPAYNGRQDIFNGF